VTGERKMRQAFYDLHAATLEPSMDGERLAHLLRACDAMPDRRRLSEGAVYMSAQRRFKMLTGADWRDSQQPADAATWTGSAHRLRVRPQAEPLTGVVWGCSCGVTDTAKGRSAAEAAHATHVALA
jgi:hypothetical protein